MENNQIELRIGLCDKAYVRNNDYADKNWRLINADIGADTNTAEPVEMKCTTEGEYDRQIYLSFDISEFANFDFKHVFFLPSISDYKRTDGTFDAYALDPKAWEGDSVTWNTRPALGERLVEGVKTGGLTRVDFTDAVKALLAKGEKIFSFALLVTSVGADSYCRLNTATIRLVATKEESVELFTRKLVEDEAENAAIWAWADKVFDEWNERYQQLLKTGLASVKKIESDPAHYTKDVYTAGSGFAPKTGWTPELAKKYCYKTRTYATMDDLGKYTDYDKPQEFDEFGGLVDEERRQEATGFFYSKKIDGRWWIIDPKGYLCHIRCMHAVNHCYLGSPNQTNAANVRYGSISEWAKKTADLLKHEWHFNIADTNFSDSLGELRLPRQSGVAGFAGAYGRLVGSNCSNGGSTRFSENNTMNVFDPEFIPFADERASALDGNKDNPWVLGYTSDNELPMDVGMLYNYLSLDYSKPMNRYSYACAWTWLCRMTGKNSPSQQDISGDLPELFRGFVWDRYYNIVTSAMRKHDPNHMILGTRFLTHVKNAEWVLRFAALYLDCMTINWYGQWEPNADDLQKLGERADLPMMVTEFYTKAMDAGMANTRGAGWLVPSQQDRADFYQGFTLRLLESKNFVGWHWHQYIDDDRSPAVIYKPGTAVWKDQSNIDANKGIVDIGHRPYTELVEGMAEINRNVYRLIDHFDAKYAD